MATEKTVKAPNYTAEQETALSTAYTAAQTDEARKAVVAEFAESWGKNARSIIAKLTNMKIYKSAGYVRKDGEPVKKKDEQADFIGKVLRLSEADTDSLTKADGKPLPENATLADVALKLAGKPLAEVVTLSDVLLASRVFLRNLLETVTTSDVVLKAVGVPLSETTTLAVS